MSDYTDAFEGFWSVYPRKVSKRPASKAFEKLSPDEQQAARIDVEKRNRAHWWSSDPRKIPHAATYLNAARWEDEWEADLIARREAGPTAAPREYKPVDTGIHMSKWQALGNRLGMKWMRCTGGFSFENEHENEMQCQAFADVIKSVVSDAEQYLDEEYAAAVLEKDTRKAQETVLTFSELLLSRLDKHYGRNGAPKVIGYAKAQWSRQ